METIEKRLLDVEIENFIRLEKQYKALERKNEEMVALLTRVRGEVELPKDIYAWIDDVIAQAEGK